ncbi:hypothetical protein [Klebsiella variicola]|uniref:hypothetical protein n=1 Tax=Klebsiella variicola TaxID=244366 RepID=UPI001E5FAA9D|nr:hypothetical protein [Klebsiella variicola]
MTKSTITREQAQKIIVAADEVITALAGTNEDVHPDDSKKMCELWDDLNDRHAPPVVVRELARMALAAMDSEPVAWAWHYREQWHVTNDKCRAEFVAKDGDVAVLPLYRHAQPVPVVEREPIAWLNDAYLARGVIDGEAGSEDAGPGYIPVYREAGPQPAPGVPDDVLDALQKVARIRLELNDFDGDRRGIADCLGDAEEALIEVVNRCAAMLAAAPQEVPDGK